MTNGMASDWYYSRLGAAGGGSPQQQAGPFIWEDLCARAQAGEFGPNDLLWNPAFPDWLPAAQVPGLFPAPGLTAPAAYQVPGAYQPPAAAPSVAAARPARCRGRKLHGREPARGPGTAPVPHHALVWCPGTGLNAGGPRVPVCVRRACAAAPACAGC